MFPSQGHTVAGGGEGLSNIGLLLANTCFAHPEKSSETTPPGRQSTRSVMPA
jgi:hypothetical protein